MTAALCASGTALAATKAGAEPRTGEAVRQVETRWSEAFITGDASALEALLDPNYVSVSASGKVRAKAEIIATARAYADQHPGEHARPLAASSRFRVDGETALVEHHGPGEVSVDVFHYADGRWRAWYSQHTALKQD